MSRRGGSSGGSLRAELARLTEENRALREAGARAEEHERLVHELRIHQVELELQNRELREAHAALEESRARYADLYDFAPIAYLTLDERALIVDINLTGATMLGCDRARLLGMPLAALIRMDEPSALWSHLRRCSETARPAMSELRFSTSRRGPVDVQVVSAPVLDASGKVVAFRTAFTDISERRRMETQLARVTAEENRLRRRSERLDGAALALSNALTRIGIAPPDELFEVIAARARDVVDAELGALAVAGEQGQPPIAWVVVGPDGRLDEEDEALALARPGIVEMATCQHGSLLAGTPRELEKLGALGELLPGARSMIGIRVAFAGRTAGCLFVGRTSDVPLDEEDLHTLEMFSVRVGVSMEVARLMEIETRERTGLRSLAESGTALLSTLERGAALRALCRGGLPWLADLCVVHEIEGGVLRAVEVGHVDAATEDELAVLRERADVSCGDPVSAQAEACRTGEPVIVASGDAPEGRIDAMLARADATSLLVVPIRSRDGIVGTLTLAYARSGRRHRELDIPYAQGIAQQGALALENARLYEASRAATGARDDLLAVVSHDLRTPLSSIALSAAVLARPGHDGERRRGRKQVDVILRSAARMGRLIDDLLEAATIEAGKFTVLPMPEVPRTIADEAIEALAPIAAQKSVQLTLDVPAELPAIACDRRRVLQVLSNLVGNAIKFVPQRGRVGVAARSLEREVRFSVSDTGPGIPASEIPRLFDRYWRGGAGGTGLGLFIARGIVEGHGGRISVESRPGEGCTFHFTIPVADAIPVAESAAAAGSAIGGRAEATERAAVHEATDAPSE